MEKQQFLDKFEELKSPANAERWAVLQLWLVEAKSDGEIAKALGKDRSTATRKIGEICKHFGTVAKGKKDQRQHLVLLFRKYCKDFEVHPSIYPDWVDGDSSDRPQPLANPQNIPTPEPIPELTTLEFIGRDRHPTSTNQIALKNLSKGDDMVVSVLYQDKTPLDWTYPVQDLYINQKNVLWLIDARKQKIFLPQVVLLGTLGDLSERNIKINLEQIDFRPKLPIKSGLDFYRKSAEILNNLFYDADNARLLDWNADTRTLIFQGCRYFDYLQTNLSLDVPQHPLETLREQLAVNGLLEPLRDSWLANATGINGLIFSNDGHMIFQQRGDNVIVRPRELCSGFSGTVDQIDIEHAIAHGGFLYHLDAPREMVEEIGIQRKFIKSSRFLGITRELIRGGQPEMFYAFDVNLSCAEILSCIPKDKEGVIRSANFGVYASSELEAFAASTLPDNFFLLVDKLVEKDDYISIPFFTNQVLWLQNICPNYVGVGIT